MSQNKNINSYLQKKAMNQELISFSEAEYYYEVGAEGLSKLRIRIRDVLQGKIYTALVDRSFISGYDLFQQIRKQYVWQNKLPKQMLQLNHETFQIVFQLRNIRKNFCLKYEVKDVPLSEGEIKFKRLMEKHTQEFISSQILRFQQKIQSIALKKLNQFEQSQKQYLQTITLKGQVLSQKLETHVSNKITQADSVFKQYLSEANLSIRENVKTVQANLVESYSKLVEEHQLLTRQLQKNIRYCKENLEDLNGVIQDLQKQLEESLQNIKEQLDEIKQQLNVKIDSQKLMQTLQRLKMVKLIPSHERQSEEFEYITSSQINWCQQQTDMLLGEPSCKFQHEAHLSDITPAKQIKGNTKQQKNQTQQRIIRVFYDKTNFTSQTLNPKGVKSK